MVLGSWLRDHGTIVKNFVKNEDEIENTSGQFAPLKVLISI